MKKKINFFLVLLFISVFSTIFAGDFRKNTHLIDIFKCHNLRLVVLCNFQGSNNVLGIVTSSRSPGYELTNYGLAQLEDAVTALNPKNITHIYTAPSFRAQQATNLLGKAFELLPNQLTVDKRLAMQNFGSAEGEDYDTYKSRFASLQDMFENTSDNGEPGLSVFNRTQDFLAGLKNLENQTILIVTHAFNFCHFSKCLTGKYGKVPKPGTFVVYDFNNEKLNNGCL